MSVIPGWHMVQCASYAITCRNGRVNWLARQESSEVLYPMARRGTVTSLQQSSHMFNLKPWLTSAFCYRRRCWHTIQRTRAFNQLLLEPLQFCYNKDWCLESYLLSKTLNQWLHQEVFNRPRLPNIDHRANYVWGGEQSSSKPLIWYGCS